ncbi:MAG: TorF family putative porin [Burkholderiales bacterium]
MRIPFGLAMAFIAAPAAAQISGSVTLHSDYRHRGVSYSEGDPSLQFTLAYDHRSGLFAGGSLHSVKIEPVETDTKVQALAYAGYARALGAGWGGEVGVLRYAYPGSRSIPSWDYTEYFAGVSHGRSSLRVFRSFNYFGEGGPSWYVDANHAIDLGRGFSLGLHAGHLQMNHSYLYDRRRAPNSRWDGRLTLSYTRDRWRFDAGVAGTFRTADDCMGEVQHCRAGIVTSVSYTFP